MTDTSSSETADDPKATIMFVDDDESFARKTSKAISRILPLITMKISTTAMQCLDEVQDVDPEVVIIDLSLDDLSGVEGGLSLIPQVLSLVPSTRVIVLTGQGSLEHGMVAIERGAASFIQKPPNIEYLCALIRDAISYAQLKKGYRPRPSTGLELCQSVGLRSRSSEMVQVFESIAFAAFNKNPVLILGETGTGKGLVAEAIHNLAVPHRKGKFLRFQPSYGSHDLIASELFGHKRGAFTGATEERKGLIEEAHLGTLFIDEIDELPIATQVTLLNVLQEKFFRPIGANREVRSDFRLISATNRNLEEILETGKMRKDFYHRISHHILTLPPLRDRKEDIIDLGDLFLREVASREKHQVQGFSPGATGRLLSYSWPGNVRELRAVVETAVSLAAFRKKRYVDADELSISFDTRPSLKKSECGLSFRDQIRNFEIKLIRQTLNKVNNNQSEAARCLQIDRSTMRRILSRK